MMIKLRSKKSSSNSKANRGVKLKKSSSMEKAGSSHSTSGSAMGEIQWELRPGGMLVQKRDGSDGSKSGDATITVKVSYGAQWHDIPIESTSTFGELKMILSLMTSLEPKEQRLLFRGKEREDSEHLHMTGVGDGDKLLLLQDPAMEDRKKKLLLHTLSGSGQPLPAPFRTISV